MRRARAECKTVAATIYVNPTQFGDTGDLAAYPRPVHDDLRVLEREGVDVVVVPSDAEMYPEGFGTWVEPGDIAARLEGRVPSRSLPRRLHRRAQTLQHPRAGPQLLWAEGRRSRRS